MFNALNGMGGGGQVDPQVSSNALVALYTTFSVGGLVAGAVVNILGPRYSMAIGGSAYALYAGSLWNYNDRENKAFVISAGAILGLGAALLWTAQGAIITSYPSETNKGKYIGIFWGIFNMGAVLGAIIPTILNWNSNQGSVNDQTYIAFMVLMALGSFASLLLLPPNKVIHKDGRAVTVEKFPSWTGELIEIVKLFMDWRLILLIPMFVSSNWYYAYQFDDVNGVYFTIRTRAFNSLWYWFAQIIGALFFGLFLDTERLNRRTRGIVGLCIIGVMFMATWAGGLVFQLTYKRGDKIDLTDLYDHGYVEKLVLYMAYGLCDAMYQLYAYWIMGALTNDTNTLSRYNGFYKAMQSAGAAISWRIDAIGTGFLLQLCICWGMTILALPTAFIVALSIKETNYEVSAKVDDDDNEKKA